MLIVLRKGKQASRMAQDARTRGELYKDKGGIMDDIIENTTTYRGPWTGPNGKAHNIVRERCNICGYIISEMHFGCCGHGCCGHGSRYPHKCKTEAGL